MSLPQGFLGMGRIKKKEKKKVIPFNILEEEMGGSGEVGKVL